MKQLSLAVQNNGRCFYHYKSSKQDEWILNTKTPLLFVYPLQTSLMIVAVVVIEYDNFVKYCQALYANIEW